MKTRFATLASAAFLAASFAVAGGPTLGGPTLGGPIGPTGPVGPSGPSGESDGNQICTVGNNGLFNIGNVSTIAIHRDDMLDYLHENPGDQFGSCYASEEYVCGSSCAMPDWKPFVPMADPGSASTLLSLQANAGIANCIIGSFKRIHFTDGTHEDVMPIVFQDPILVGPDVQGDCAWAAINLCSKLNNSGL